MISCFKEGKKCAGGRALLQAQMENLNDGSLHENPFDIVDEDVIAAAPAFIVIKEDDVDDDLDIKSSVFFIDVESLYLRKKVEFHKNVIDASLF